MSAKGLFFFLLAMVLSMVLTFSCARAEPAVQPSPSEAHDVW